MIYKERTLPKKLVGQQALLLRLNPTHEKFQRIKTDFLNAKAGFGGEREFDYKLREFQPAYPHAILHDICLQQDGTYFQMDSLLITPGFIVIFEIKNVAGKLNITTRPTQFIKELPSGERSVLQSPIAELERKRFYLNNWLKQRNVEIPIVEFVVFAYQNELSIESPTTVPVAFSYEVPNYLRAMKVEREIIGAHQIKRIANKMVAAHQDYVPFPLCRQYKIDSGDIQRGIVCEQCQQLTMNWNQHKAWKCSACGHRSKVAHRQALSEWYCLIGDTVTNQQFRRFTRLRCRHTAKSCLNHPAVQKSGRRGRGAIYTLDFNIIQIPQTLQSL